METEETKTLALPVALVAAATRALGGIGVGLLLAEKMDRETRRVVGGALLAAGIASTFPLLRYLCASCCRPAAAGAA
jgi:hypothetical protein